MCFGKGNQYALECHRIDFERLRNWKSRRRSGEFPRNRTQLVDTHKTAHAKAKHTIFCLCCLRMPFCALRFLFFISLTIYAHKGRVRPCVLYSVYNMQWWKCLHVRCAVSKARIRFWYMCSVSYEIPTSDLASLFRLQDTEDDAQAHTHIWVKSDDGENEENEEVRIAVYLCTKPNTIHTTYLRSEEYRLYSGKGVCYRSSD